MNWQPSPRVATRHHALLERLWTLNAEPPCWGARRIWVYLCFVDQGPEHQKRLLRRMRAQHLLVLPHHRLRAKRPPAGHPPKPTRLHEWGGLDMTKVMVEGVAGFYLPDGPLACPPGAQSRNLWLPGGALEAQPPGRRH